MPKRPDDGIIAGAMELFLKKPKIKLRETKKEGFDGWVKCPGCSDLIHKSELERSVQCCPKCGHHHRLSAKKRIALLSDAGSFEPLFQGLYPIDSLGFIDTEPYGKRIEEAKKKSGSDEAVIVGACTMGSIPVALGVMDFGFMGGSMGSVVGERLTLLLELALDRSLPVVVVTASGGARMQESVLSLMQMAKNSAAIGKHGEAGLPYICVLTDPTTGGVTASFATLGDVILAEPGALIAFAGPRVVEQTTKQKLPKGAQRAEFLLERGMIDGIVKRSELKKRLVLLLDYLAPKERVEKKVGEALKGLFNHEEHHRSPSLSR